MNDMSWYGLGAPAGLDAAVLHKLNIAAKAALQNPELIKTIGQQGAVVDYQSPQQFRDTVERSNKAWAKLIKDIGFKNSDRTIMYSQVTYPTSTTAVLSITDAGVLNVLSTPVIQGLIQTLSELAENKELHCLVLRGSGSRAFVAGADIKELASLNAGTGRAFISGLRDLCNAVRHFPVPVIVRLEGHTLGGGLELAMAGDLRIAADNAVVGMPEVKVGIPSVIHAAMMTSQIGTTRAAWLLLTGENIPAAQARNGA
jgi:1,4-dihydroxy-2-naphthoyl-CoA synthase